MSILVVYGTRNGTSRSAALLAVRTLRGRGVPTRARAADRIARRPRDAWVLLLVDRAGASELRELRDSYGLRFGRGGATAVRCRDVQRLTLLLERGWAWRQALGCVRGDADPNPGRVG
ncbi:MAG: hypothetical protein WD336_00765 [Trueperaceae bacterium]